jgi:hypothetical protein
MLFQDRRLVKIPLSASTTGFIELGSSQLVEVKRRVWSDESVSELVESVEVYPVLCKRLEGDAYIDVGYSTGKVWNAIVAGSSLITENVLVECLRLELLMGSIKLIGD